MNVSYFADVSDVTAALRDLAEVTDREFPDVVRQAGRTLSRELARETYPLGLQSDSKKGGELAIVKDINKVYTTPEKVYHLLETEGRVKANSKRTAKQIADAFAKTLGDGNTQGALDILRSSGLDQRQGWGRLTTVGGFDGGAAHKARRNKNTGRVNGEKPTVLLTNSRGMKRYIEEQKKKAGTAKAAWAETSALLGSTRGFPAWIRRNMRGQGKVDNKLDAKDPAVILHADLRYETSALPADAIAKAQRFASQKMAKHAKITIDKAVEKFNRRSYAP